VEPENEETITVRDVKFDETQLSKALDDGKAEEVLQLVDVTLVEREIAPAISPSWRSQTDPQTAPETPRVQHDDDIETEYGDADDTGVYATPPDTRDTFCRSGRAAWRTIGQSNSAATSPRWH
jgi:hypothetical protein